MDALFVSQIMLGNERREATGCVVLLRFCLVVSYVLGRNFEQRRVEKRYFSSNLSSCAFLSVVLPVDNFW